MQLVDEIRNKIGLEIRECDNPEEYFEAVFESKDLDALQEMLERGIGKCLKPPGGRVRLPKNVNELAESFGGLRPEQSFYFKEENGEYIYAALWPWESNSSRITLKIGSGKF